MPPEELTQINVLLTKEQKKKAKELSKKVFGKENMSGLYGYMLIKLEKELKD